MIELEKVPLSLVGKFDVISKSKSRRVIAGYANIAVVDSQNQLIPLETLKAGLDTLLRDMSYANLMLSHNNIQIGKILKSYGKLTTHVDDKGLFLVAELRDDTETANETWAKIIKGEMNGFSIGCEVLSEPREVCDVNGCVTYLDKINILEVSICGHPVNKMSGFTIVSKSDSLSNDVCKSCNIMNDKMTDKIEKETIEETKEEPKELSVEERIEAIERAIFNMQATITKMSEVNKQEEEEPEKKPVEETPEEEKKPEGELNKSTTVVESSITKKDFDDFKDMILKSLNAFIESLKPDNKIKSELELAIKARDEQIDNMKKQIDTLSTKEKIKTVEKAEENSEPKTIQDKQDGNSLVVEEDCPIVVNHGEVSARKFV